MCKRRINGAKSKKLGILSTFRTMRISLREATDPGFLDKKERAMYELAAHWHSGQTRKYSGDPYTVHLLEVARQIKELTGNYVLVCAALGHDLFEDTACRQEDIWKALKAAGFPREDRKTVIDLIFELTDEYSKAKYPRLNRRARKTKEAERLGTVSRYAQTIKYADIINNALDLAVADPGFARVYVRETIQILQLMNKGDFALYSRAIRVCAKLQETLEGHSASAIVESYLQALEKADLDALLTLFADDAIVHSPRYGKKAAETFYRELFADTVSSSLELFQVFEAAGGDICAYFHYDWTIKSGALVSFDVCDIFVLNADRKIRELRIIYFTE